MNDIAAQDMQALAAQMNAIEPSAASGFEQNGFGLLDLLMQWLGFWAGSIMPDAEQMMSFVAAPAFLFSLGFICFLLCRMYQGTHTQSL